MQKLAIILLATAALAGCTSEPTKESDWTKGDGCEKYFSETSRELANCKAYVKALAEKEGAADVSLDKAGATVARTEGLAKQSSSDKILDD